jgi:tellurite methyltransferase
LARGSFWGSKKMNEVKESWNRKYSEVNQLLGLKPKSTLVQYTNLIPKQGKVLDLGIGEGRNALYFSSLNFEVEGVDISEKAIQRCSKHAEEVGLDIKVSVGDLRNLHIQENAYSLIILSNVLNFFSESEVMTIMDKAKNGLIEGGLIYINVFDINDPAYEESKNQYTEVSTNTFYRSKTKSYLHYFTMSELESYFIGYNSIKFAQTYSLDLGHGEPHFHGTIELLIQR